VNTRTWVCGLLDQASAHLLRLEEEGVFPGQLRVGSDIYAAFTRLRQRDLRRGLPLLVLGVEVTEDPALSGDEFSLVP
jgi:hypothetical protein